MPGVLSIEDCTSIGAGVELSLEGISVLFVIGSVTETTALVSRLSCSDSVISIL